MVLGAVALSQDYRRSRPRSRPWLQRAAAAGSDGFRRSVDGGQRRRAYQACEERARGLGRRQFRSGLADRAGSTKLEDAQPPIRGYLLVGPVANSRASLGIMVCIRRDARGRVDGYGPLGYVPAANLRSMDRRADNDLPMLPVVFRRLSSARAKRVRASHENQSI